MKLNNLKPAEGSTHSRRRIGRGPGSGLGGTSTRGHKGAKARSGYKRKIGYPVDQNRTLDALGLRKISQVVEVEDTPSIRGMIRKVHHLVTVVE